MAIDLNILKNELLTDPLNLGYANFVETRNDMSLHSLINEVTENQDIIISRGRISRDEFIELTSQVVLNLMLESKNGNNDAKFWLDVFDRLVANSDTINVDDPSLDSIFTEMLNGNLIDQNSIDFVKIKFGSRAQKLFGSTVTLDDVSNSLNEVEN